MGLRYGRLGRAPRMHELGRDLSTAVRVASPGSTQSRGISMFSPLETTNPHPTKLDWCWPGLIAFLQTSTDSEGCGFQQPTIVQVRAS